MVGRKTITRTRTGTHSPCIQSGSTLFPSQAALDHRCAGGTIERKPAQDAPHKLQRSISQRREASLRRLLVKCRLSAGRYRAWSMRGSTEGRFISPQKCLIVPPFRAQSYCVALLQFGRRGTVEHIAPGTIQQFERVGFDRERSALARQLGDLVDPGEYLLQLRVPAGPHLIDIQQL